jgi:hypothetical protein
MLSPDMQEISCPPENKCRFSGFRRRRAFRVGTSRARRYKVPSWLALCFCVFASLREPHHTCACSRPKPPMQTILSSLAPQGEAGIDRRELNNALGRMPKIGDTSVVDVDPQKPTQPPQEVGYYSGEALGVCHRRRPIDAFSRTPLKKFPPNRCGLYDGRRRMGDRRRSPVRIPKSCPPRRLVRT